MRRSKRIVVFLGAGASRPFGFPLTSEILPYIKRDLDLWEETRREPRWCVSAHRKHTNFGRDLRRFVIHILPGMARRRVWNGSIIDVLSQVDHLIREGLALTPEYRETELRVVRHMLNIALRGVLLGRMNQNLKPQFVSWILRSAQLRRRTTILSTNYDVAYDLPLFRALEEQNRVVANTIDMGVSLRTQDSSTLYHRPKDARVALFKLHGSLNWLRCEVCRTLYVNTLQSIASLDSWIRQLSYNSCYCNNRLRSLMVAPSLVRDTYDDHLSTIWNAALEDLRLAGEWIFIGYSLPMEDVAIRNVLLRAFHNRNGDLRVRVALFDPQAHRTSPHETDAEPPTKSVNSAAPSQKRHSAMRSPMQAAPTERYTSFFPREVFDSKVDYYPGGVAEIIQALAAEDLIRR